MGRMFFSLYITKLISNATPALLLITPVFAMIAAVYLNFQIKTQLLRFLFYLLFL